MLSDIDIASTLKVYLSAKVFDNFVVVFNQWAVSNKLGSMKDSTLNHNKRKIEEAKYKKLDLKKICEKYEEEVKPDLSEKLVTRQETSKLAQSFVNEFYFGSEDVTKSVDRNSFLDRDTEVNPFSLLKR